MKQVERVKEKKERERERPRECLCFQPLTGGFSEEADGAEGSDEGEGGGKVGVGRVLYRARAREQAQR